MINREEYLRRIADRLSLLKHQVSTRSAVNLHDINIVSESFFSGLINLIEEWDLINANTVQMDTPGIDLVDDTNRISIQVTADNTTGKIRHTIDEFIKNHSYEKYDRLIILILTDRKNYRAAFDTQGKFIFNQKEDIWDINTLIQKINSLDTDQIKAINDYLQTELSEEHNSRHTEANEVETILALIEFITAHKQMSYTKRDTTVDPEYKIYRRFREFASRLTEPYMKLLGTYGTALADIENALGSDNAQELVTTLYLQELSIKYLDETKDDPVKALDNMVDFFEEKLGNNGKKYDQMAIRFYLIHEMIKCNVFPNIGGESDGR